MRSQFLIPMVLCLAAGAPAYSQAAGSLPVNCEAAQSEAAWRARYSQAQRDSQQAVRDIRGALENDVREAARAAGIAQPAGVVLVQLRDRRLEEGRVWSFRSNVPDDVSRTVMARNAELLARWPRRDGLVNLRLDAREAPDSATVECAPVLLNPTGFMRDLARALPGRFSTPGAGTRRVSLHLVMLVTRDGEVAHAEFKLPGTHGNAESGILRVARRLRFRAATIENVPVDVWVEQPVELDLANE
jgi:hypothetical protein